MFCGTIEECGVFFAVGLFDIDKNGMAQLQDHYYINGGYILNVHEDWDIKFDGLIKITNPVPVNFDVNAMAYFRKFLWFGAGFRYLDAVVINAGVSIKNFLKFGYSYDYPITNIAKASSGTHEAYVSLQFGSNVIK